MTDNNRKTAGYLDDRRNANDAVEKWVGQHPKFWTGSGAVQLGIAGGVLGHTLRRNPVTGAVIGAGLGGAINYLEARHHQKKHGLGPTGKPLKKKAMSLSQLASFSEELSKQASMKLQGSMNHQGIPIAIENRKGSVRKGVDKDGKPWRTEMVHPYGYIKGSKGADGEEVDAYVGPHEAATHAYVVHQRKSDGKGYDEDKVMMGFPSKEEAVEGYLKHYNSDKFLGPVKEVPVERLKELLQTGKKLTKISFFQDFSEKIAQELVEQFIKEAELSPSEAAHYKELLQQKSKLEQAYAASPHPSIHEQMIHNTDRLTHYGNKKRDPNHKIPSWVKDNNAKPPPGNFRSSARGGGGTPPGATHEGPSSWRGAYDAYDSPRPAPHFGVGHGAALGGMAGLAYSQFKKDSDPKSWAGQHRLVSTGIGAGVGAGLTAVGRHLMKAAADELSKVGAVTDEQAQAALNRYETLERQRPTAGQMGRYAALGAVAGPAVHVVGNLARGRGLKGAVDVAKDAAGNAMSHGQFRTLVGTAAAGAVGTGAVPLIRTHLDRNAERKTLRKYMGQTSSLEKDSGSSGITPAKPWAANESADLGKYGASATPMGTFSAAKRVGLPRVTNVAGPSIASQVGGHGRVLPGAGKGGIGKGGVSIGSSGSVM